MLFGKRENLVIYLLALKKKIVTEPRTVANEFNTYFSGIAEKVRSKIPVTRASYGDRLKQSYPRSMFFRPTDKLEVYKIITSLDQSEQYFLHNNEDYE